jgi:hypothetical protein
LIGERYGKGAYIRRNERLRSTAIGKSRPRETAARIPDSKVSLGGLVGVEKKMRCR